MAGTEIIAIILMIAFIILYGLMLYTIIKAGTKGTLNWIIIVISAGIGILFILYLSVNIGNINASDWAQIVLTLGLVSVTSIYAWATNKMARANAKMAEEMREQRYDTIRPIIDIELNLTGESAIETGLYLENQTLPKGMQCILRNIGLGPAIDMYSNIVDYDDTLRRHTFGTAPIGSITKEMKLSLKQRNKENVLVVYYRDAYGRKFESSRDVNIVKEGNKLGIGPLKVSLIKGKKNHD